MVVIVTVVILSFTLFTVQTISIDFRTSITKQYNGERIVKSANIKKGQNIFFLKKNKFASNVEKAFPYLEVINIETLFPSKLVIHLRERQSLYALKDGDEYLLIDSQQKVLEKTSNLSNEEPRAIVVNEQASAEEGELLNNLFLTELYEGFLLNGKTREDELAIIKQIDYFESENEIYHNMEKGLMLTLQSGRKVFLHNAAYGLAYKISKLFSVLESLSTLAPNFDDEVLQNAEIHINNYIGSDHTEKDTYFALYYNGEKLTL